MITIQNTTSWRSHPQFAAAHCNTSISIELNLAGPNSPTPPRRHHHSWRYLKGHWPHYWSRRFCDTIWTELPRLPPPPPPPSSSLSSSSWAPEWKRYKNCMEKGKTVWSLSCQSRTVSHFPTNVVVSNCLTKCHFRYNFVCFHSICLFQLALLSSPTTAWRADRGIVVQMYLYSTHLRLYVYLLAQDLLEKFCWSF